MSAIRKRKNNRWNNYKWANKRLVCGTTSSPPPQGGGPAPLWGANLKAAPCGCGFFTIYGYWDSWKYYYSLRVRNNTLIVEYLFPTREHEISNLGNIRITTETETRKGLMYRIKLETEGRSFTSQQMTRTKFEANRQALTQEIQKRTDLTRPVER